MNWEDLRFPGHESLRERVAKRCGKAEERFAVHRHKFGDWVDLGQRAPRSTVILIERDIADHLSTAARVGRSWGTRVGVLLGIVGAAMVVAAIWLAS